MRRGGAPHNSSPKRSDLSERFSFCRMPAASKGGSVNPPLPPHPDPLSWFGESHAPR